MDELNTWHDFFAAVNTAASTLTGLLFVSLSINKEPIASDAHLRSLARQSLLSLLSIVVMATLCLIPNQPPWVLGLELAGFVLLNLIPSLRVQRRVIQHLARAGAAKPGANIYPLKANVYNLALLCIFAAGVLLALNQLWGLYCTAPAVLLLTGLALYNSWMLLLRVDDQGAKDEDEEVP